MQERLAGLLRIGHFLGDGVFLAQAQAEVPQLRLLVLDEPGQRHGGAHVRQRVMRSLVRDAVGHSQVFELERRPAIVVRGPADAVGPQRIGAAHHVQQIPAAALVLPFAGVGVDQVAPEQEAGHLVVEADRVVAHADRARLRQFRLDRRGKGVFRHAACRAHLWCDAGQQAALGVGQRVGRGLAVQRDGLADLVQVGIGAQAGELRRAVAAGHHAEGFVVVPEEADRVHGLQHTTRPQ